MIGYIEVHRVNNTNMRILVAVDNIATVEEHLSGAVLTLTMDDGMSSFMLSETYDEVRGMIERAFTVIEEDTVPK